MLYYHGTTKRSAEAIRREGLKPHRETAYELVVHRFFGDHKLRDVEGEDESLIYVSPDKNLAMSYAIFRAEYEKAKKGTELEHPIYHTTFVKDTNVVHRPSKPALVVMDIPKEIERKLERDVQDSGEAYVCACVIGPEHIKRIEVLDGI